MDIDNGRVAAKTLENLAESEFLQLYTKYNGLMTGFEWEGPDSEAFRQTWASDIKRLFDSLKEVLTNQAMDLMKHVADQEAVSGATTHSASH
ncbi:hypothetical protein BLA60_05970 [Actinophytocola xinjiangensis]|uniref:WXG100 family type VII secretion target n=2 Tax=Actinophytocola xinjiangensis TaxID=485602 RepID=A0A7Z0WTA6_9PSEU|nr:hypothetical protein BLA60_05970 [Actinophytocola xinjiangensis]